jgi:hypothetical protein
MRPATLLVLLVGLAACADPRAACLSRADAELRAIDDEIVEIQVALARGYRVSPGSAVRAGLAVCARDSPVTVCLGGDRQLSERRIAIDRRAEESRLRALQARRPGAEADAARAAAACPAT